MATFLSLVQDTERESGTMPSLLSTTVGQTGRHQRFVKWVQQAWEELQSEREDWRWMRASFSGSVIAGTVTYDPGALGITRFGSWVHETLQGNDFTLWVTADGQSTEGYLRFVPWEDFRRLYMVGAHTTTTGTPTIITVTPDDDLRIWPIPDAACTMRGEYMKSPQSLSADADIPELPTQFHHAIRLRALLKMATFDEAWSQFPAWQRELATVHTSLLRTQTPRIRVGRPLA